MLSKKSLVRFSMDTRSDRVRDEVKNFSPATVGVIDAEGPPVPIPNTEVKLCRADDTWLVTARENR